MTDHISKLSVKLNMIRYRGFAVFDKVICLSLYYLDCLLNICNLLKILVGFGQVYFADLIWLVVIYLPSIHGDRNKEQNALN